MLSKYGQFSRQFKTRGALKIVLRGGRNGARIKSFYSLNHEIEILSQDPKETRNTLHLNGIYISVKHDINIIVPCHSALRKVLSAPVQCWLNFIFSSDLSLDRWKFLPSSRGREEGIHGHAHDAINTCPWAVLVLVPAGHLSYLALLWNGGPGQVEHRSQGRVQGFSKEGVHYSEWRIWLMT